MLLLKGTKHQVSIYDKCQQSVGIFILVLHFSSHIVLLQAVCKQDDKQAAYRRHTNTRNYWTFCDVMLVPTLTKAKESHGYDEVTTKILKISAPFISSPLTYIFNKSTICEIFLSRLKYAIIKPIFKNGDKKKVANYRPISLLSSFSKFLEKVTYSKLMNHWKLMIF